MLYIFHNTSFIFRSISLNAVLPYFTSVEGKKLTCSIKVYKDNPYLKTAPFGASIQSYYENLATGLNIGVADFKQKDYKTAFGNLSDIIP
jgi:hypothetical protein